MFTFITGLIAVLVCGALIGYERQFKSKIIGIRTCILIMLGSFVFTYISIKIGGDPSRVTAQIASGVARIFSTLLSIGMSNLACIKYSKCVSCGKTKQL